MYLSFDIDGLDPPTHQAPARSRPGSPRHRRSRSSEAVGARPCRRPRRGRADLTCRYDEPGRPTCSTRCCVCCRASNGATHEPFHESEPLMVDYLTRTFRRRRHDPIDRPEVHLRDHRTRLTGLHDLFDEVARDDSIRCSSSPAPARTSALVLMWAAIPGSKVTRSTGCDRSAEPARHCTPCRSRRSPGRWCRRRCRSQYGARL